MYQHPIIKPPEKFSFLAKDWKPWFADGNRYRRLSKLKDEVESDQIDSLIYHMGSRDAENLMRTFKYGKRTVPNPAHEHNRRQPETIEVNESPDCYEDLADKFNSHYVGKVNTVNESTIFNKRKQAQGESIDSFIIDLERLVLTCDYQDPERQVRDRFIAGLNDENSQLQERLQFQHNITLTKAVEYARRWEMVQGQVKKQKEREVDEVHHFSGSGARGNSYGRARGRGQNRGRGRGWNRGRGQSTAAANSHSSYGQATHAPCGNCNGTHDMGKCPARGKPCHYCGAIGHFMLACRKKKS